MALQGLDAYCRISEGQFSASDIETGRIWRKMASFSKVTTQGGKVKWRARIRKAKQAALSGTFPTLGEAKAWAAMREDELRTQRYGLAVRAEAHTFGEMVDRYIKRVLPHKTRKPRFRAQQKAQLEWWKARLGHKRLIALTTSDFSDARDDLLALHGPGTVNRYIAAISHVFSVAVKEWEWLPASPIDRLRKPRESRGRARYLDAQELRRLLDACGSARTKKPLGLIVRIALYTAARKGELLGLKWRDIDVARGVATLRETKNGEPRPLFLSKPCLALLEAWRARPASRRSVYVFPDRYGQQPMQVDREFRHAVTRACLIDFHFHDLRHTAASYLAMNGASSRELQEILGHRRIEMVNRYAHLSKSHTSKVVASMNERILADSQGRKAAHGT